MLTRRTSGGIASLVGSVGGLLSTVTCGGGERLVDFASTTEDACFCTNSLSTWDWETPAARFGETPGDCTPCELGNLHFPSASCGQTTSGLMSETSLITSLREKSERKRTRSRNVSASRKCLGPTPEVCAIVIPLSWSPPQGVTLMPR